MLTGDGISESSHLLSIENTDGMHILTSTFRVCPNPRCKRFSLVVTLSKGVFAPAVGRVIPITEPQTWNLVPPSNAKAFPAYVPMAVREDYEEACLIKGASPKASATLARRALQGMIRDFWGIKKARLVDEVDELQGKIDDLTWQAIEAVRKIGNIGAHMEKDVSVIVDVKPEEAERLIWLIELLVREWYIAREERRERLQELATIAQKKTATQQPGTAGQAAARQQPAGKTP
jgi:hypothetical protein